MKYLNLMLKNKVFIVWVALFISLLLIIKILTVLDRKKYEKVSTFFVGCNLNCVAKPISITIPETTGHIANYK